MTGVFADRWRSRVRAPVGAEKQPRRLGPAPPMPGPPYTVGDDTAAYYDRLWAKACEAAEQKLERCAGCGCLKVGHLEGTGACLVCPLCKAYIPPPERDTQVSG